MREGRMERVEIAKREGGTEASARSHDDEKGQACCAALRCASVLQLSWLGEAHEALCAPRFHTKRDTLSFAHALAPAGAERVQKGAESACTEPFDVPARRARVCASSERRAEKTRAGRATRSELHACIFSCARLAPRLGLVFLLCWSRAAACLQLDSATARPKDARAALQSASPTRRAHSSQAGDFDFQLTFFSHFPLNPDRPNASQQAVRHATLGVGLLPAPCRGWLASGPPSSHSRSHP